MGVRNGAVPALKGSTTVVDLKDNPSLMYKHYGVDIMTLIHPSLRHPDCAAEFSMLPLIPLESFKKQFAKRVKKLLDIPVRLTAVCDGAPHPHKKGTNEGRANIVRKSLVVLRDLQKQVDLGDKDKKLLNKAMKTCVTVREDVLLAATEVLADLGVKLVCASLEADFQVRLHPRFIHIPSLTPQPRLYSFVNPTLHPPRALSSLTVHQARATGHH